jgi:hypothetical protein
MEDLCLCLYKGKELEAIFLYNFFLNEGEWCCDVVFCDDNISTTTEPTTVFYDQISFVGDSDGKKKRHLLDIEVQRRVKALMEKNS